VKRTGPCALCGNEVTEAEFSADHVFGEAFGAKSVVRAHKSCNNKLGAAAEAALHRPSSFFSLVRAARGLPAPPLTGTAPDGTPVRIDLIAGTAWPARPDVAVDQASGSVNLTATGLKGSYALS
jgi:hypothetical protein